MAYFTPYLDDTGIHMPTYEDRLADLSETYRSIFGNEAELSSPVPDYQLLSVFSKALDDASALVLQACNARNPMYAAGAYLDALLPQYGLTRGEGESDASLRARIRQRLQASCSDPVGNILRAARELESVWRVKTFVNDTDAADSNGIPPHSLAFVLDGGNIENFARVIQENKAPGIAAWGSTTVDVTDAQGNTHPVSFTRCESVFVFVYIMLRVLEGGDREAIEAAITPAIRDHINKSGINTPLNVPLIYGAAYSSNPDIANTYFIQDVQVAVAGAQTVDRILVPCDWNEKLVAVNGSILFFYS